VGRFDRKAQLVVCSSKSRLLLQLNGISPSSLLDESPDEQNDSGGGLINRRSILRHVR
jgi:hypothetical protein